MTETEQDILLICTVTALLEAGWSPTEIAERVFGIARVIREMDGEAALCRD